MLRTASPAVILLLLAACGTPQEQCIARVTSDLRVAERLIGEAEGNLSRGYAIETVTEWEDRWRLCDQGFDKNGKPLPARMCAEEVAVSVDRPKAIDLDAEAVKLRQLKAKRIALLDGAEPAIAACRKAYPE